MGPIGRVLRFICIAVVCDHPAAVKMCGSADKGHTVLPCTRCVVPQEDFFSDMSLCDGEYSIYLWYRHALYYVMRSGYKERDSIQHIIQAYEYASLATEQVQEAFFKKNGVRWFEFARLPYFDPVRMTIIDPMHNLLIGATVFF